MALTELARETTTGGASRAASRAACEVLGVLIHGETERVERGEGVDDATDSAETEGGGGCVMGAAETFAAETFAKGDDAILDAATEHAETLFGDGGDAEVRGVVAVMTSLAGDDEEKVKRVMDCVTSRASERVILRVRCAMAVYNDASERASVGTRLDLFERVAKYCVEAKQTKIYPILIAHAGDEKIWGTDAKTRRRALKTSVDLLRESNASEEELFACMIKYLATFENDAGAAGEAADIAKETVRAFIASPTMFHGDFMSLQGLKNADADALKLLSTLLTGSVSDYKALNASIVSRLGLNADECMAKMRIMALSTLGKKGEVTYAEIKDALQCADDEVEEWVVRSVGAGVVDAKMDQSQQRVVFTRCTDRVWSGDEWKRLSSRIAEWRTSVASIQKTLAAK